MLLLFLLMITHPACAEESKLKDGVYQAKNSIVDIEVIIQNGRISDINILEHRSGGQTYDDLIRPMTQEMIEQQSADIDTVTGATISSDALKSAVGEALKKAIE